MLGRYAWRYPVFVISCLACATLACTLGTPKETDVEEIAQRPLVLLAAPTNGSVVGEGVEVALHAIAQDSEAGVARIEFRINDVPVGEVKSSQPNGQPTLDAILPWTTAGQSGHLITVEAFRPDGASLGKDDVTIKVVQMPGAQIIQPALETPPPAQVTEPPTDNPPADAAPPPAAENPAGGGAIAVATVNELNVRQGPGTNYPTVGALNQGDRSQIVGRNADSTWWAISFSGGTAWVIAELVTVEGDVSGVPLVAAP